MTITIALDTDHIDQLDLSPIQVLLDKGLREGAIATQGPFRFQIDYQRDPDDPRELSEIPEIRLWFVRLDSRYPWLPYLLDWEAGELARYTAMLVPHQFSPTEGIQYNLEALELFVMHKVFVLSDWMQQQGIVSYTRIKFMTQLLGYELDDAFFSLLQAS
jgi:hypothetical protein